MPTSIARESDWLGRVVGLVVFLIGIGLLIAVFVMVQKEFPDTPFPAGQKLDTSAWSAMGVSLVTRFARLFLLGFVASWIAGRGAQMYAAGSRAVVVD